MLCNQVVVHLETLERESSIEGMEIITLIRIYLRRGLRVGVDHAIERESGSVMQRKRGCFGKLMRCIMGTGIKMNGREVVKLEQPLLWFEIYIKKDYV